MNCPEVVEVMQRYLDYDLSQEEVEEMFSHIASCSECAETFRMLKSLSRELEDLPEVTPKFSLVDAIMPQLDEIDRSRQERSAASDPDDTIVPLSARKTRRQRLLSSMAGRTLLGTAAAAIVLVVAVMNNEPRELSNAEMQLMTTTTDSQDADQSALSHLPEDTSEADAPVADQDLLDQSISSTDSPAEQKEIELPAASQENMGHDEPVAANQVAPSSPTSDAAKKSDPSTPSQSQETGASNEEPSNGTAEKSSQEPTAEPSANSSEAPDAAEQQVPDAGIMRAPAANQDAPAVMEAPDQPAIMDDSAKREATEPEEMFFGIQQMPLAPQQWLSADQLHLAMLEGTELVLYSVTNTETHDMKEVQRIGLKGEWVSGEWSVDSKVFHYQTNQDGKMVKDKVTVSKSVTEKK